MDSFLIDANEWRGTDSLLEKRGESEEVEGEMGEAGQKYRVRNANERDRVRGGGGDVKEWNVAPSPLSFRE